MGELAYVDITSTVGNAVQVMNEVGTGCVLVVEQKSQPPDQPSQIEIRGIFTERDVLTRVLPTCTDLKGAPIVDFMTRNPSTLTANALLAHALRSMATEGYRHIPVIDDNALPLGVVSMRQIVQHLVDVFPSEILNVPPETQRFPIAAEGG
jgi:CBS domain-containing protein